MTDEYVDCAYDFAFLFYFPVFITEILPRLSFSLLRCDHYSNFGLLFSSCNSEEWTIWRILSLSFLLSFWVILIIFFTLVLGCQRFRVWGGLETMVEKRTRVLGEHSDDRR